MSYQKPARCAVVPVVILLLVLGMTFGMVCHHHADSSATTCPICHMVLVPLATGVHLWWVPTPVATMPEAIYMGPSARSVPRLPARAPPAA
jgi:predicted permease